MSTRSGKQIHAWFHETLETSDLVPTKNEAKVSRSKKLKENNVETLDPSKLKKRRHYVSYPASDEAESAIEETVLEEPVQKSARKLRRFTLKEKNIVEPDITEVKVPESKKSTRPIRRNKKASEDTDLIEPEVNAVDFVTNGKLTGKKNIKKPNNIEEVEVPIERATKIPVPKSKKSKKKKKGAKSKKVSSENIHTEENSRKENIRTEENSRNNTSVDSFYSAAGSPIKSSPEVRRRENKSKKHQAMNVDQSSLVNSKRKNRSSLIRISSMDIDKSDDKESDYTKSLKEKKSSDIDKDSAAIDCEPERKNSNKKTSRKRKSNSQPEANEKMEDEVKNSTVDETTGTEVRASIRKSSLLKESLSKTDAIDSSMKSNHESTFSKDEEMVVEVQNSTSDQNPCTSIRKSKRKSSLLRDIVNKSDAIDSSMKSNHESTFSKDEEMAIEVQNSTSDQNPGTSIRKSKRKSSLLRNSFNKSDVIDSSVNNANVTFDKSEVKSLDIQNSTFDKSPAGSSQNSQTLSAEKMNSTYDKISSDSKTISLNSTYDKDPTSKIDTTFDKTDTKTETAKSSLVSSDDSNVTLDKSNENSHINITSDESKTENILNTFPVLIESSLDESQISNSAKKTPPKDEVKTVENEETKESLLAVTPLKREGTFTKDEPDPIIISPKRASIPTTPQKTPLKTPTRQMSLPSPGCTPFPGPRSASQQKSLLNVTRSLEKSRRSSLAEDLPHLTRQTRVMFCSPVDASTSSKQQKGKIIKSSMKGSNKSFVFDEDMPSSSAVAGLRRKRSFTADADHTSAKRSRLAQALPFSERTSRQRTASATVRPTTQTPKPMTPSSSNTEAKVSRTKLPNFAALHRKQFARMESLDECQTRKAKRARHLLTPNGNIAVLERSSPSVTKEPVKPKETKSETKKSDTKKSEPTKPAMEPKPMLPTLESLRPGFTRFGFKMNIGVNPFISPIKSASKAKEIKPNGLKRQGALFSVVSKKENKSNILNKQNHLPSLVGATSSRKEMAKHTVLREKSFSHSSKRDETRMENRTIIKGVRTNRRFELQMQMRNIDQN